MAKAMSQLAVAVILLWLQLPVVTQAVSPWLLRYQAVLL